MNTLRVAVRTKALEAADIHSFELVPLAGASLPRFTAGAHVDVHMPNGVIRQYSICSDPNETHRYIIAVLHEPASRGGSIHMHDKIAVGDILTISEPHNNFGLEAAGRYLLFAGGIGVTPLLSMAEWLDRSKGDFVLHYFTRSRARCAFFDRIQGSGFADQVKFHFDDATPAGPSAPLELAKPDEVTRLYICGPAGFIDWIVSQARAAGWDDGRIHIERFVNEKASAGASIGFEVKLAKSGGVYFIPEDQTIISVLEQNGIDIPYSCEQGVCGTCVTPVLQGRPDHRDACLTDAEREHSMTLCCSRSLDPLLVLDL